MPKNIETEDILKDEDFKRFLFKLNNTRVSNKEGYKIPKKYITLDVLMKAMFMINKLYRDDLEKFWIGIDYNTVSLWTNDVDVVIIFHFEDHNNSEYETLIQAIYWRYNDKKGAGK